MGPGDLDRVLSSISLFRSKEVQFGAETRGDAGAWQISNDLSLLLTIDFFAPVVDDPFDYGWIAATNAMSDVWAMGGSPFAALNIVGFPDNQPRSTLQRILLGGAAACREAKVSILGGHTVRDEEPKYGLAVIGKVHPRRMITNAGARPGDVLILTKPIGTGLITTGIKRGMAPPASAHSAVRTMKRLNRSASETMLRFSPHACTDVTGFGLLGHLHQMIHASGCGARIHVSKIPSLPGAVELLAKNCFPGGTGANLSFLKGKIDWKTDRKHDEILLADPQTSGGLLIAARPVRSEQLLASLRRAGDRSSRIIGEVVRSRPGRIEVLP